MSDHPNPPVQLSEDERASVVQRKATCPFIGSAVAQGDLPVHNDARRPLARIEDVRRLGNSGGGDLGDLLVLFASGNHALMPGDSGRLDQPVASGLFSLDFPGSQGSHPGHSGILQGDPAVPGSGRFDRAALERLTGRAQDGWISRAQVGRFIGENLAGDPASKVFGTRTARLLASDLVGFVETSGSALLRRLFGSDEEARETHRDMEEKLTKLLGEDNLVGSAGEFGLLFAFLAHRPGAREIDGDPAVAVEDLETLFVDRRLPDGWRTWKKTRLDWVTNTTALLIAAGKEYRNLKRSH